MEENKKEFKNIRTIATKAFKDIDNLKVRVEALSAFIDKFEYKLYEQVQEEDDEEEEDIWQ
jgi:hypothetical protein